MGSERVPEGPDMAPKTLLRPCGPMLGGGRPKISKSFWAKIGQKSFVPKQLHSLDSQRVWDPQKLKIDPVDPPVDPLLGPFCGHFGPIWGQKKSFFSQKNFAQNHFILGPRWSGTLKNPKLTPQWTPFGRAPALPVATQPAWSRT